MSCVTNPWIYGYRNRHFRDQLRRMLCITNRVTHLVERPQVMNNIGHHKWCYRCHEFYKAHAEVKASGGSVNSLFHHHSEEQPCGLPDLSSFFALLPTQLHDKNIQSVFNLILDIHVMFNWQLTCQNRVSADQFYMTVSRVYNWLFWRVFLKFTADQLLVFNWSPTQVHFLEGIQFASCLWQKLNYFRKTFFKTSHKSFAFGLLDLFIIIVSVYGLSACNVTWTKEARLILQSAIYIFCYQYFARHGLPSSGS